MVRVWLNNFKFQNSTEYKKNENKLNRLFIINAFGFYYNLEGVHKKGLMIANWTKLFILEGANGS